MRLTDDFGFFDEIDVINRREYLAKFVQESNMIEGISIVHPEHITATEKFLKTKKLTIVQILKLAKILQEGSGPGLCPIELRDKTGMNVYVGDSEPPPGGPKLVKRLKTFLKQLNNKNMTSYDSHLVYEYLHPLTDCNGRTGRAIWLWLRSRELARLPSKHLFLQSFYYQTLISNSKLIDFANKLNSND
jgi:hypothetical protein